MVKLHII